MNLFSSSQGKLSLAKAPFLKNWQFTTLTKSFFSSYLYPTKWHFSGAAKAMCYGWGFFAFNV